MKKQGLILVCGRPGSGKSTLAKVLAQEFHAVLIDKDCVDEAFSPGDRGPFYVKEIQPKCYQTLLNIAEPNLQLRRHVILDAPWTHNFLHFPELATQVEKLAAKTGSELAVLDIELPKEVIRQRLMARGFKRDEPKLTKEGWEEFVARHRMGEKNPLPHFLINGQESLEICAKKAIEYIQTKLRED